jgi:hypothetical protein
MTGLHRKTNASVQGTLALDHSLEFVAADVVANTLIPGKVVNDLHTVRIHRSPGESQRTRTDLHTCGHPCGTVVTQRSGGLMDGRAAVAVWCGQPGHVA